MDLRRQIVRTGMNLLFGIAVVRDGFFLAVLGYVLLRAAYGFV